MKIYWRIVHVKKGRVFVQFWKREDKRDMIETFVATSTHEGPLRERIEEITGAKHYELVYRGN